MRDVRAQQRLALEDAVTEADSSGGYHVTWRHLGWVWAEMDAATGRERSFLLASQTLQRWRITVRAAPHGQPNRPMPGQRFRLGARGFRIEAVAERGAAGRWLDCFAIEETAA